MEQSSTNKITLLFGRICSGKSSYMPDSYRISVSNLVKGILNTTDRSKLQNSEHLDQEIADSLLMTMFHVCEQYPHVIVDGIRQVSIVDRVLEEFPDVELVWLEVPTEERKRRYEHRKDTKDVEPFEIADNKPIELECQKIFTTFKERLKVINNYEAHYKG
jgi:hypothetical protein